MESVPAGVSLKICPQSFGQAGVEGALAVPGVEGALAVPRVEGALAVPYKLTSAPSTISVAFGLIKFVSTVKVCAAKTPASARQAMYRENGPFSRLGRTALRFL